MEHEVAVSGEDCPPEGIKSSPPLKPSANTAIKCLKCDKVYIFPADKDDCLAHLYLEHRLVIADVEDIALLEDYLQYWEKEFQAHEFEQYCTTMFLDQLPDGKYARNEKYYLLCDILPQDYELRRRLKEKRLSEALERHQFELTDRNFSKECLFCRTVIEGLRADYLDHLFDKHFLLVGKPEKLVYVDELLDHLEENLNRLMCLYCEKIFRDRPTLKEHMRKKGHKRINPNRREYDKYFLINYNRGPAAPTPRKQQHHSKRRQATASVSTVADPETGSVDFDKHFARPDSDDEHDSDWSDWAADGEPSAIKCLYCPHLGDNFAALKDHMLDAHRLDFDKSTSPLNFYQRVKVVNYLRRQMCVLRCVTCDLQFDEQELLVEHMAQELHCGIGDKTSWDKPEFFFPYMENDGLLCVLDDSAGDDTEADVVRIISEDSLAQINKDAERLSLENFKL
ncbi:zinc finger protein 277 [Drosophila subpulchrella]|uniref:zinc finger protein 277 n=1 Tax=Drosophila subpulchrella TaxID=1486046 RepID=UPI0018A17502|nr:zinc finger protein 277 [Drosophila subpulchrella]